MLTALIIGAFIFGVVLLMIIVVDVFSPRSDVTVPPVSQIFIVGLLIDIGVLTIVGMVAKDKNRWLAFTLLGVLVIAFSILALPSFGIIILPFGIGILIFSIRRLLSGLTEAVSRLIASIPRVLE